jgi:uncharacterized repeat protein (TIGR01451 family)
MKQILISGIFFLFCTMPFLYSQSEAAIHTSLFDTEDPIKVGKQTIYVLEVQNEGESSCNNVRVKCHIPGKMRLVAAYGPRKYYLRDNSLTFRSVSVLRPGEKLRYRVVCRAIRSGSAQFTASVQCDESDRAITLEEQTSVYEDDDEVGATHFSIYDTKDPVVLGRQTIYVIEIRNEGRSHCTNIKVQAQIPDEMKFISAYGPMGSRHRNGKVIFSTVDSLAPGEWLRYRVVCQARETGSAICTATLQYDDSEGTIVREEETQIYRSGDDDDEEEIDVEKYLPK